jgi:hypothetical protein
MPPAAELRVFATSPPIEACIPRIVAPRPMRLSLVDASTAAMTNSSFTCLPSAIRRPVRTRPHEMKAAISPVRTPVAVSASVGETWAAPDVAPVEKSRTTPETTDSTNCDQKLIHPMLRMAVESPACRNG